MSATDELRAMLNERGVKWSNPVQMEGSEFTRWHDANGTQWTASEVTHADSKLRIGASHVTPAQAVEATMGCGECKQVLTDCHDGLMPPFTAHCSACGDEWGFTPNYCPNCGRRVKR